MFSLGDIIITSIDTITAFNHITGNYRFTLSELQNATVAQTQDSVEITGKMGRKLSTLKRNKAVKISGANGLISGGLLELQLGSDFETKATKVLWTDYLTVDASNKAHTSWKAVGTAGQEIDGLYIKNANATLGTKLEQDSAASAGKFAYDPATKEITLHTDIPEGTELVAYYKRNISADVLENRSDKYSGKATLYIDAVGEDICGDLYHVQIYVPKADFSGELSIEMGDNQVVHNFEAEALPGACGGNGEFFTFTVFGSEEEDI